MVKEWLDKKPLILPGLLILLTGCFCMGFWGDWDFYIVNDHPMRIQYLWDTLKINLPIFHKLIYWNPFINCGEPSLSLYPPGFVIFGAMIDFITFHILPVEIIYKFLLIFAYYLPGFTSLLLYKKLGISRISAALGALIMMLYSDVTIGGDVEGGMVIGLLNMRLAVGLAPLVLYFAISCLEAQHKLKNALFTGLTLGLCLLTHPWDSFLPLFGVIFLFIFNVSTLSLNKKINSPQRHREHGEGFFKFSNFFFLRNLCDSVVYTFLYLKKAGGLLTLILILAVGLSAFWTLPAFIHREFLRRATLWDFSIYEVYSWIKVLTPFILLYLISMINTNVKKITPLAFLPPLMLILIFLSYIFRIELFEPTRLKDNFFFSILIFSGVGIDWLCICVKIRVQGSGFRVQGTKLTATRQASIFLYPVLIACLIIILILPFMNLPSKSSYTTGSIAYYDNFARHYQMNEVFDELRNSPPGRILFTSSSRPMQGAYHTHIFALTPLLIGREIIGGVPTTHTPVANYLYYGGKQDKNTDFAEVFDNNSIFGMRYDKGVDTTRLHKICKQLNITTIVVGKYEDKVLSFFKSHPEYFPLRTKMGGSPRSRFHIFDVSGYKSCLLDYDTAWVNARVIKGKMDEIHIKIFEAKQTSQIGVKISYYPLWKVYLGNTRLKINQDEFGLIKIEVPKGKDYLVKLKYEDGLAEQIGWIITLMALISILVLLLVSSVQIRIKNYELKIKN
ncbi:MAG: hypothetical protein ABIF11_12470 [Nitrospirota bacterium]